MIKRQIILVISFSCVCIFNTKAQDQNGMSNHSSKEIVKKDSGSQKNVSGTYSKEVKKNENSYPLHVSSDNQSKYLRTKEIIEYEILCLKEKTKHVKADSELDKEAKTNGWYEQTRLRLKELEEELTQY